MGSAAREVRRIIDRARWLPHGARLRRFKNIHAGKRCFIIGNGPSLGRMDLAPLRHELTFGANRIYLLFPKTGFETTYLVCVNDLVLEQCAPEISRLTSIKFLSWSMRRLYLPDDRLLFIRSSGTRKFHTCIPWGLWEGATVTFASLQLAHYMGFSEAVLVGVDHDFASKGKPGKEVVSAGADPDHFHPDYFGKGFRWQLPDLATSEAAYRLAKARYEADGRRVLDATVGGKLTIFPKVAYGSLF